MVGAALTDPGAAVDDAGATPADPPPAAPPAAPEPEEPAPLKTRAQARAAIAPPPPEPPTKLYRVWPHGTLQRNGQTYQPGDTLSLPPEVAAAIPCLEPT